MNKRYSSIIKLLLLTVFSQYIISCSYFEGKKEIVDTDSSFFIRTGAEFDEVLDSLNGKLIDLESFTKFAKSENYPTKIKPGKYKLPAGITNKGLVRKLMLGEQTEVKVRIPNSPTIFHMAGAAAKNIEIDSAQIVEAVLEWGKKQSPALDDETVKIYFIPETYHFYWTVNAENFVERMVGEFNKAWNEDRQQKAKTMGFTSLEVFTLASIVQLESYKPDEQPRVAKAYLNRLEKGMKLEADPTSIYAYKLANGFDHTILRVKSSHLDTASDYNTYRVTGLPPAPICLPDITAVDAVLNPDSHDFIFFCADPDKPGYHLFTSSYAEHQKNAARYRKWLNEQGIR